MQYIRLPISECSDILIDLTFRDGLIWQRQHPFLEFLALEKIFRVERECGETKNVDPCNIPLTDTNTHPQTFAAH
jgi:hypothetical protein